MKRVPEHELLVQIGRQDRDGLAVLLQYTEGVVVGVVIYEGVSSVE